jgi:16S rRNA processing protein RimM
MPGAHERRPESRILLGAVTGAHGIRGEVRIKVFAEDPMAIASYGPLSDESGERTFTIARVRPGKGVAIAALEGVSNRNEAEALHSTKLYALRAALPEAGADEFYHADLVGVAVEDRAGKALGTIIAVHDFGAGPILEIAPETGDSVMAPFTREVVPEIDVEAGRAVLDPPPGLFDGAEPPKGNSQ